MLNPVTNLIEFDRNSRDRYLRPYGSRPVAQDAKLRTPLKPKVLRAVRPGLGIEASYRRKLDALITEMHDSVLYWVRAKFKNNEPRIAQDAIPAEVLRIAIAELSRRWTKRFDEASDRLAEYFATAIEDRSTAQLKRILRDGGWTVKFQMTPAMRDVFEATINQNVALIKSIPQQYLASVEQMVQQMIQGGGDLYKLSGDIQDKYGVTKRRAALIARDQNNKANASFQKARQLELGITEAIWMHSHAGKEPRPSHVAMNGKKYDIKKGMWDPTEQEWIMPGQLINCRCTSRPVVPGFT